MEKLSEQQKTIQTLMDAGFRIAGSEDVTLVKRTAKGSYVATVNQYGDVTVNGRTIEAFIKKMEGSNG